MTAIPRDPKIGDRYRVRGQRIVDSNVVLDITGTLERCNATEVVVTGPLGHKVEFARLAVVSMRRIS